ncbi:MAG: cytochrome [Fibrobacteres bacterium]|nr:cytochrome [Fibrobacterota bacterium]
MMKNDSSIPALPLSVLSAMILMGVQAWSQSFDPHPVYGSNALTKAHPGYDMADLLPANASGLPAGFSAHVGGMAFLPNGKLALADFPDPSNGAWKGSVWLFDGVQTGDKTKVTSKEFANNLYGPTGLTVVNGDIYVIDGNSLRKLTDKDSNGTAEVTEITHSWHQNGGQPAVADLVYQNGFFYSAIGSSGGLSVDGASISGGTAKIGMDGKVQMLSSGFRNTGGAGINSKGEIFATDNQGEWLPSSKFINVVPGRYYGYGGLTQNGKAASPPAVWIPQGVVSPPNGNASTYAAGMSPGTVLPIDTGLYAGQYLMGDIRYGNVDRIFLERVGGEYQGALFHFSGGFRAGIYRMTWGPDGALYLGGMGGSGYTWSWKDNTVDDNWGLYRMKPNSKPVFEMVSVKAKAGGFEVKFTQPVDTKVAAANFKVQSWRYVSTGSYGGPQVDMTTLPVQSVQKSTDPTVIFLGIQGLLADHVVHIELDSNAVISTTGLKPWTFETWYTLNRLGTDAFNPTPVFAAQPTRGSFPGWMRAQATHNGGIQIESETAGSYEIRDARGTILEEGVLDAHQARTSAHRYEAGLYFVSRPGSPGIKVICL